MMKIDGHEIADRDWEYGIKFEDGTVEVGQDEADIKSMVAFLQMVGREATAVQRSLFISEWEPVPR